MGGVSRCSHLASKATLRPDMRLDEPAWLFGSALCLCLASHACLACSVSSVPMVSFFFVLSSHHRAFAAPYRDLRAVYHFTQANAAEHVCIFDNCA